MSFELRSFLNSVLMCFSSYIVHRVTNTIDFRVMEYMASAQKQMTYLTDISHFISARSSTRFSTKSTVTIFPERKNTDWNLILQSRAYQFRLLIALKMYVFHSTDCIPSLRLRLRLLSKYRVATKSSSS